MAHQTISQIHTYVVENDMSGFKDKNTKDYWIEDGNQIVRVHKLRSKLFDPKDSPHPTIPEHALKDERKTLSASITGKDDEWKEHIDNWRTGMDTIKTIRAEVERKNCILKKIKETIPLSAFDQVPERRNDPP